MIQTIELAGRTVEYDLQRKKVKNINLRIKSDGTVHVSASSRVPLKAIESFLQANGSYILRAIDKFAARRDKSDSLEYKDGEYLTVLGYRVPLRIARGNKNLAEMTSDGIFLTVKDTESIETKQKAINLFIYDICRRSVCELCEKIYPEFADKVTSYPTVKFRRMHTKWGICRPTRNEITFSYMLSAAPVECIEYVIYHELCHFLHPNHSREFYACLSEHLPDWKERKTKLDGVTTLYL